MPPDCERLMTLYLFYHHRLNGPCFSDGNFHFLDSTRPARASSSRSGVNIRLGLIPNGGKYLIGQISRFVFNLIWTPLPEPRLVLGSGSLQTHSLIGWVESSWGVKGELPIAISTWSYTLRRDGTKTMGLYLASLSSPRQTLCGIFVRLIEVPLKRRPLSSSLKRAFMYLCFRNLGQLLSSLSLAAAAAAAGRGTRLNAFRAAAL